MGYVVLIAAFILIAVLLNGTLGQTVNRRVEYPALLTSIREDNVKAVAIRGTSLVGLYRNGSVADVDFPERGYAFETTIGSDFLQTAQVVKRKSVDSKPMTEEEAILQMELLNHDFFLFKNIDEDCYSVIYKRRDGQYGIINAK